MFHFDIHGVFYIDSYVFADELISIRKRKKSFLALHNVAYCSFCGTGVQMSFR
jgi:hypothetical protein